MQISSLISVIMTAYNREKYVGEAIERALASTYENFELIIVMTVQKTIQLQLLKNSGKRIA